MVRGDKSWSSAFLYHPETIKSDGMRRQIMVIRFPLPSRDNQVRWRAKTNYGHFPPIVEDSMSFDQDYCSLFCHPETSESIGMQRQIMVICLLLSKTPCLSTETIAVSFAIQRQVSSLACRDKLWSSAPFCRRLHVFRLGLLQSPLPSRHKRVYWHVETKMFIFPSCRRLNVFRPRLLKFPLSSRDNQVRWHAETNIVICPLVEDSMFFDRDYCSLPLSSRGNRVWWHAKTIMVIRFYLFLRLLKSPFPSGDKQVCWHAETVMVIRFHCFWDYWSLICHLETSESVGTRRLWWSFIFIVFETIEISLTIQRQASLLARGDYHGHPFSLFSRQLKSPLPSRDKRVCWHPETIMVIHFHYFRDYWSLPCHLETR